MKYIRTKDGIYELESSYEYLGKTFYGINERITSFTEEEIIDQADTIEELCDEFVVIVCPDEPNIEIKPEICNRSFKDILKICEKDMIGIQKLYGAIWTDKGLIYVAKMNDEGELELL